MAAAFMDNVLLLVIVTLVTTQSLSESQILQHPQSVTVGIGEIASFNCSAHAEYIHWRINGRPLRSGDVAIGYISKSTTVLNKMMNIRLSTLRIRGMPVNNGYNIACLASIGNIAHHSDNATLYVQDPIEWLMSSTVSSTTADAVSRLTSLSLTATVSSTMSSSIIIEEATSAINLIPSAHDIVPTVSNPPLQPLIMIIAGTIVTLVVLIPVAVVCMVVWICLLKHRQCQFWRNESYYPHVSPWPRRGKDAVHDANPCRPRREGVVHDMAPIEIKEDDKIQSNKHLENSSEKETTFTNDNNTKVADNEQDSQSQEIDVAHEQSNQVEAQNLVHSTETDEQISQAVVEAPNLGTLQVAQDEQSIQAEDQNLTETETQASSHNAEAVELVLAPKKQADAWSYTDNLSEAEVEIIKESGPKEQNSQSSLTQSQLDAYEIIASSPPST